MRSCYAPWCGIAGKYANPGVCNAPGGHRYDTWRSAIPPLPIESRAEGREVIRRPKLVRDWIPEIIHEHGDVCDWRVLDLGEYVPALLDKLVEEAQEARDADGTPNLLEELADVQAVINALLPEIGEDSASLTEEVHRKFTRAGGFGRRILLEAWTWTGAHLAGYHADHQP